MLTAQQQTAWRGFLGALLLTGIFAAGIVGGCDRQAEVKARPVFVARITLTGNSMFPLFHDGEEAGLELCAYNDIRTGDPVQYWHSELGKYICHELVGRDATGRWVTRGINNPGNDRGHMDSSEFVGRVRKLRP